MLFVVPLVRSTGLNVLHVYSTIVPLLVTTSSSCGHNTYNFDFIILTTTVFLIQDVVLLEHAFGSPAMFDYKTESRITHGMISN